MPCLGHYQCEQTRRNERAARVRAKLKKLGIVPGSNKYGQLWHRWMR